VDQEEADMESLITLLDRERLLLELVTFKLVELRQLLLSGETRFLGWASEELDRALSQVRAAELERAVLVASIAADRSLPGDALTLSALIADAPEPYRTALAAAQTALRKSTEEVAQLLSASRRVATDGARGIADTLQRLDGVDGLAPVSLPTDGTYGRDASWSRPVAPRRVEHSL
jgi:hypothetical protein